MNSAVKSTPCALDSRSILFSLLKSGVLLRFIPLSTPIMSTCACLYLLGNSLKMYVPEDAQFLQDILHGVTSFFESITLLQLTKKASTYAAKSAFNSAKTLLVGAIVTYQANILQSETSENGESLNESRDGYLSQKNPNNSEYLQEAARLSKESVKAVLYGGITGSLSIAKDWFKALIFSDIP